jgi:hypothetical protein
MIESETPLSDLIGRVIAEQSEASYERFLELFVKSEVGVVVRSAGDATALAAPAGTKVVVSEGQLSYGTSVLADGRRVILACAEFAIFRRRFAGQFNATVSGSDLLKGVLANPGCDGIQINSAATMHSLIVDRQKVMALLNGRADGRHQSKPWWRLW